MPHDPQIAEVVARWMRYARADLAIARAPLPEEGLYEQLCFHAQQAAEKGLKAVLIRAGIDPPRTHDLQALIDLLPANMPTEAAVVEAVDLTDYAISSRYPGAEEPVGHDEYCEALKAAEAVVAWAQERLQSGSQA